MDYEFNFVLDLSNDNNLATVTKKRGSLFEIGQIFKITEKTGEEIKQWMEECKPEEETKKFNFDFSHIDSLEDLKNIFIQLHRKATTDYEVNELIIAKDLRKKQLEEIEDKKIENNVLQKNLCEILSQCESLENLDDTYKSFCEKNLGNEELLAQLEIAKEFRKGELHIQNM